jgi:hypothetical protein
MACFRPAVARSAGLLIAMALLTVTLHDESRAGGISRVGSMTVSRAQHSATRLADGRVLLAGGFRTIGKSLKREILSSAELYNPKTRKCTPVGSMSYRRSGHIAVMLDDGSVLVAGGVGPTGALSSAEIFTPASRIFTTISTMTQRRAGATAIRLNDGRILIAGGGSDELDPSSSAEIFDPRTRTFSAINDMILPRGFPVAATLPSGFVLITGGSSRRDFPLASVEIFNPAPGTFQETGSMLLGRTKHAAVSLHNGDVYVFGGMDDRDWKGFFASVERYTPGSGGFQECASMRHPRARMTNAVVVLGDGSVFIGGGNRIAERYFPEKGVSVDLGSVGTACYYSTATLLQDGSVLIAGGYDEKVKTSGSLRRWRP